MFKISVCLLTYNSARLLREVLPPLITIADDFVVLDSGSNDATLDICREYGLSVHQRSYDMHGQQMNHAIKLAAFDWVLCMDSDEILDEQVVDYLLKLKAGKEPTADQSWRLPRYWYVLGKEVRTLYPISSPDFPVRLFNRQRARFNDRPVDDQVVGEITSIKMPGRVRHDTFHTLHEMFNKLNSYTTRLVKYRRIRPSVLRGIISAVGAFFKWYLLSGAWREGKVGAATGLYAALYSFMKYFKAWHAHAEEKSSATAEEPNKWGV